MLTLTRFDACKALSSINGGSFLFGTSEFGSPTVEKNQMTTRKKLKGRSRKYMELHFEKLGKDKMSET